MSSRAWENLSAGKLDSNDCVKGFDVVPLLLPPIGRSAEPAPPVAAEVELVEGTGGMDRGASESFLETGRGIEYASSSLRLVAGAAPDESTFPRVRGE